MNKKAKTALTLACVGVLSLGSMFAGCNKKSVPDTDQTLEVFCAELGYGSDWCEAELNAFKEQEWVKEKYPELQIVFEANADRSAINTRLQGGLRNSASNSVDLIFSDSVGPYMGQDRTGVEYSCDLTEVVYNTTVPGENVTVYDKLLDPYKKSLMNYNVGESSLVEKDFQAYNFNWASGMRGILYNQELLEYFGYKNPPRTSDELIEMCEKISADTSAAYGKGYAFMWSGAANYIGDMYNIWWAQYEGYDQYTRYYNGIYFDGRYEIEKSPKIFEQQGRAKALDTLISVMNKDKMGKDKGYMYPYGASQEFKVAQYNFIKGNGVFMANGDWFAKEMEVDMAKSNYHIRMMKSPVISSIKDKTPSITTDAQLRTVIARIDAGYADVNAAKAVALSGDDVDISGVSAADYNRIIEARGIIYSTGPDCDTCIPSYAKGKEVAFDFLRFLATDIAQEVYMEATGGASLPFKYNVKEKNPSLFNSFSDMQKDRYAMEYESVTVATVLPKINAFPLVKFGGLSDWSSVAFNGNTIVTYAMNGGTAKNAVDKDIEYWTRNNARAWLETLRYAGLQ